MSTSTVISNMALSHCKAAQIASINDTSKEAKACKQFYSVAKQYMQENHHYGFLERRVALALIPTATFDPSLSSQYTYAYAYPGDCLIAEEIYNPYSNAAVDKVPFILQSNATKDAIYILTNQESAYLIYTSTNDSFTSMHSATFQLALSYVLAWLIAMTLTGDKQIRDDNLNLSFGIKSEAKTNDSNEQSEDLEDFDDYPDAML